VRLPRVSYASPLLAPVRESTLAKKIFPQRGDCELQD
jgi:hypothetical protein